MPLDQEAEARYRAAAADKELGEFWSKAKPTRAPYSAGEVLCRGATFYPKFAEVRRNYECFQWHDNFLVPHEPTCSVCFISQFLEKGGIGK